jgi:hypothetical protein
MWYKLAVISVAGLVASQAYADGGCDAGLTQRYRNDARVVDSLRPDKPSQMRVYAVDGSEFTAGQARWMAGQLRKVERYCTSGSSADTAQAARATADVEALLKHHSP